MPSLRKKLTYQWEKDRERGKYESYTLRLDDIQISVFNGHIDYPGIWIMNCPTLEIYHHRLNVSTSENGKKKAIEIIKSKIERMVVCFNKLGE